MRVELLDCSSPAWRAFLDGVVHDFYHLPDFVALSARRKGGQGHALLVESGERAMLLPLIFRRVPKLGLDAIDAVSPTGYPGPLLRGAIDEKFVHAASASLFEGLRENGVVAAFVRLHPLLNRGSDTLGSGTVVAHGETISINLKKTPEQLWSETRQGHRYQISRAIREGHRVYIDHEWRNFDAFVALYYATMRRVNAAPYYMFTREYFVALRAVLGSQLHLGIVEIGNDVAAAGLFVESCGIVEYHLSGMNDIYARSSPTKLLLHAVRQWARDRGNSVLHLGGGLGATPDSLFRFKAGFSNDRNPFRTWRIVVDPQRYRGLVESKNKLADSNDITHFFPAYRNPGSMEDGGF